MQIADNIPQQLKDFLSPHFDELQVTPSNPQTVNERPWINITASRNGLTGKIKVDENTLIDAHQFINLDTLFGGILETLLSSTALKAE